MTSFVTTTRVESSRVLRCISGHFHSISEAVVLWGYSNRLELYREEPSGVLSLFHKQHTHDRLLELGILHGGPSREQSEVQALDMPVLLFASHRLAVLRFDPHLHRFITVHAVSLRSYGVPALLAQPILHVDSQTWTIALSPDRKTLVVLSRSQDSSISSLLSEPVKVDVSIPEERPMEYECIEHPRIAAMTLVDVPTDQGLSKRCLFVLTSSKHTIAAATVESSGPEAAEPVPAQLHRVMMYSIEGGVYLEDYAEIYASISVDFSSPENPAVDEYYLAPYGHSGGVAPGPGVLCFRAGELATIIPIPCKTACAVGDVGRRGVMQLVVKRYSCSMTSPEAPGQCIQYPPNSWQDLEEVAMPPIAVCSVGGACLLWSVYGLHRVNISEDRLEMTRVVPQGAMQGQVRPSQMTNLPSGVLVTVSQEEGARVLDGGASEPLHLILPRGAIEGHPLWSWLQDPGEMACLPSGGLLMVSKGHGIRVLDSAAADTPLVTQMMNLVPELASAFTTVCSRMGQKQALALSHRQSYTDEPIPSKVHMLHGSRVMDCLYESSPDYAGVTGLFPVSLNTQDDMTAAVVISFASGSRALTTGDTFSDITDSVGLDAEAQSLGAATISAGCMAQVTSAGIRLCLLHTLQASGTEGMDMEGTPRKRPSSMHGDSPLSGCGAEQGAASGGCSSEQEASEMFSSRRGSTLASRPSYEAQARSSSSWEAQPIQEEAATWQPPGRASVTCAVVMPGLVIVATAQPHALTALVLSHPGSPSGRGAGMGKRKRSEQVLHLLSAASIELPDEVSCVHAIKRHEGVAGSSFLCMAGLHGAVLALYMLRETNHECGQWSFQPLCSMHAPPASFCHNWESASDSEDVPGSILLLADACSAYPMQALVGWRSGLVMQVECKVDVVGTDAAVEETAGRMSSMLQLSSPSRSAVSEHHESIQTESQPGAEFKVLCVRRMGSLPVQLTSLTSLAPALCMSEHIAFASFSPGSSRLMLEPLACESILHAAPLLRSCDNLGAPDGVRWCLLTASECGTLRILGLVRDSPVQVQSECVATNCRLMAFSEDFNRLGFVNQYPADPHHPTMLHCMDLNFILRHSNKNTTGAEGGLRVEVDYGQSVRLPRVSGLYQAEAALKPICIAAVTGPMFHNTQAEWHAGYAVGGGLAVAAPPSGIPLGWLHIVSFGPRGPFSTYDNYFDGAVTAVVQHQQDDQMQDLVIASAGSRLVCLRAEGPLHTRMRTEEWTLTREALTAINVCPGSGLIAAVGPSQSALIYRYTRGRGFELLCADPDSHSPVACLPLSRPAVDAEQDCLLLDQSGLLLHLRHSRQERQIECNMHTAARFHMRTPAVSLCYGSMRREDLGVPEGPGSQCMTACSRDGSVVEIAPLLEKDWYVLATVQSALQQERITAPLSWVEHDRFRHGDGRNKKGTAGILDGDFLAQLEHLPRAVVQQILNVIDTAAVHEAVKLDGNQVTNRIVECCRSAESVLQILDRTLSVLWPPPSPYAA